MPPSPTDSVRQARRRPPRPAGGEVAPEAVLSIALLVLICIGLILVYSTSSSSALLSGENPTGMLIRQGSFAVVALIVFAVLAHVDPTKVLRLGKPALLASLGLLVLVLIPGFGIQANGARSWLGLGPVQMQPAEFAKLAVIIFLAGYLAKNADRLDTWEGLKIPLGIMAAMAGLLILQPDLGTAVVLLGTAFLMLVLSGVPARMLGLLAGVGVSLAVIATIAAPYRMARFTSFLDPWSDPEGRGFQVTQAQLALGSGGVSGVGLGNGMQKVNYLPEAHTDMIIATMGEEIGLIGVLGVIALIGAVVWSGYRIALSAPDLRLRLMAGGLVGVISIQAIVNLGAVLGLLPVTGVPLPFVSYGGSSLVVLTAASGILVAIGRRSRERRLSVVPGGAPPGGDRGRRDRRAHHAGARAG